MYNLVSPADKQDSAAGPRDSSQPHSVIRLKSRVDAELRRLQDKLLASPQSSELRTRGQSAIRGNKRLGYFKNVGQPSSAADGDEALEGRPSHRLGWYRLTLDCFCIRLLSLCLYWAGCVRWLIALRCAETRPHSRFRCLIHTNLPNNFKMLR